jgi:hypothetical protein
MKQSLFFTAIVALVWLVAAVGAADEKAGPKDNMPPEGFTALFNGKDLTNWKVDEKQAEAWKAQDGLIHYTGKGGRNLATAKNYKNFEMWVDWKITKGGDSGIYLRGYPQVQIWDNKEGSGGLWNNPFPMRLSKVSLEKANKDAKDPVPATVTSKLDKVVGEQYKSQGALTKEINDALGAEDGKKFTPVIIKYAEKNGKANGKEPLEVMDKPIGEWNTFWIKMVGTKVWVKFNDKLVVDNQDMLEGKIKAEGPLELQVHGTPLWFKNVYVKELPDK